MADDKDVFGKIDALLEKAGFDTDEGRQPEDDFPLLTEVVEPQADVPPAQAHRQDEPRKETPDQQVPHAVMSEEQFNRFLAQFERKLEDLFIRQQLRIEKAIRRALQSRADPQGAPSKRL